MSEEGQMSLWGEAPAKPSPSRESASESMIPEVGSCSNLLELCASLVPAGFSGKTSQEFCRRTKGEPLAPCSGSWKTAGFLLRGECLTLNSSEWPNAAAVCSLSQILERGGGAAQVLVERGCMFGDSLASKEKRQELAEAAGIDARCAGFKFHQGAGAGGIGCEVEVSPTLTADWHQPAVYGLSGNVIGREEANGGNQTGYCDPDENGYYTLTATDRHGIVCIADDAANAAVDIDLCGTLKCGGSPPTVALEAGARRLTPRECERLQGFPDDWTLVPYRGRPASECPDGPRYKAVGNSMAVPVMRWIGERIARVEGETE